MKHQDVVLIDASGSTWLIEIRRLRSLEYAEGFCEGHTTYSHAHAELWPQILETETCVETLARLHAFKERGGEIVSDY